MVVVQVRGDVAQTHAAKEAIWLRKFVSEIRGSSEKPLTILCDNQGAIALAKDNKFHARTKHIDLRYHFIREAVEDGKIAVKYVPTDDNISDIFTKALPKPKFQKMVEMLGLKKVSEAAANVERSTRSLHLARDDAKSSPERSDAESSSRQGSRESVQYAPHTTQDAHQTNNLARDTQD